MKHEKREEKINAILPCTIPPVSDQRKRSRVKMLEAKNRIREGGQYSNTDCASAHASPPTSVNAMIYSGALPGDELKTGDSWIFFFMNQKIRLHNEKQKWTIHEKQKWTIQ